MALSPKAFQKPCNNQTWQDERPTRTDASQQVAVLSPALGRMKNMITKRDRITD